MQFRASDRARVVCAISGKKQSLNMLIWRTNWDCAVWTNIRCGCSSTCTLTKFHHKKCNLVVSGSDVHVSWCGFYTCPLLTHWCWFLSADLSCKIDLILLQGSQVLHIHRETHTCQAIVTPSHTTPCYCHANFPPCSSSSTHTQFYFCFKIMCLNIYLKTRIVYISYIYLFSFQISLFCSHIPFT